MHNKLTIFLFLISISSFGQQKDSIPNLEEISFHFESENESAILFGDTIQLFDKNLKSAKIDKTEIFIETIGKSLNYYNGNKSDDTCKGYKYVKIIYQGDEYITSGKNVVKLERLDVQPIEKTQFEFFIAALSNDYLQPLKPSSGFDFCEHLTFSPVLILNVPTHCLQQI
ncbi:hypothetical protein [Cellulophaga sp. Z1A5H]|uniref:hypothetical protein n=1 Tax=Cellulophaga sp. Z1A5H TaxID=2687291 RepID=UPI0013FE43B7|nr:hypothetical protein [Cellulophaga sp. Z1A5H]